MRWLGLTLVAAALVAMAAGDGMAQLREESPNARAKAERSKKAKKKAKKPKKSARDKARSATKTPAVEAEPTATGHAAPDGAVQFVVKSSPRGAEISVDGTEVGVAPVRVTARRGRRVISAKLAGHVDAATTVEVEQGLGFMVFSLAPEGRGAKLVRDEPAERASPAKRSGFGTDSMNHGKAMQEARFALKRGDHAAALRYADTALASKPDDQEAQMIATIAACGTGDRKRAERTLPARRGSYRDVSIKRCKRLGVTLP